MMRRLAAIIVVPITLVTPASASGLTSEQVTLNLSHERLWDSNFDRVRDGKSEQRGATALALGIKPRLAPHDVVLRGQLTRFRHQRRANRDATTADYTARWEGPFLAPNVTGHLELRQREQPAERLEFAGGDIVARRRQRAQLTYGDGPGWRAQVRGTRRQSRFESSARQANETNKNSGSVALIFVSERESSAGLRFTVGEQTFPGANDPRAGSLAFNYRQLDLEVDWRATDKTRLEGRFGYFDRSGDINDGSGSNARLRLDWEVTENTTLSSQISLTQPSTGENPTGVEEERRVRIGAEWQPNDRWRVESAVARERRDFGGDATTASRQEDITEWTPLALAYTPGDMFTIAIEATRLTRDSRVTRRDFNAETLSASVEARF